VQAGDGAEGAGSGDGEVPQSRLACGQGQGQFFDGQQRRHV